ncbi:hypothetical protein [Bradyrhizobium ivorense]|nr:hypothetical protein [Bradyrhizobium ivorense]VIO81007.1 hypothetical protein CI41S_76570 [Bradyrhizobium ivorense]
MIDAVIVFNCVVIPGHSRHANEPGISRHNFEVPGSTLRVAPE